MEKLSDMPNIGKVAENNLIEIGIETPDQLRQTGSHEAFMRLRSKDSGACLHLLMGLEGAIQGVRKYDLPDEDKRQLKQFFDGLK